MGGKLRYDYNNNTVLIFACQDFWEVTPPPTFSLVYSGSKSQISNFLSYTLILLEFSFTSLVNPEDFNDSLNMALVYFAFLWINFN